MSSINISRERSVYASFSDQAIQARNRDLARLQEQLGTNHRVNRASDDPVNYGQARTMEVLKSRYEQYGRSVDSARGWVDHTQQVIDSIEEFFAEALERGTRISNDSFSDSDRQTFADRLEFILNNLPDLLNEKHGDEYLFAGSRTTQQPFSKTPVDATDSADLAGFYYNGNDLGRRRHIGIGQSLDIAVNGESLWRVDVDGGGIDEGVGSRDSLTGVLQGLITAVRSNDTDAINTSLSQVKTAHEHILRKGAEAGAISNRLTMAETQLMDYTSLAEQGRSDAEDIDLAETLLNLQKAQVNLEAALKSSASLLQISLMDYLR